MAPALTWTFTQSISAKVSGSNISFSMRCAGPRGVTLAITQDSVAQQAKVWRSVNGGVSWSLVASNPFSFGGNMSLQWVGGTNWFVVAFPGLYYTSTNDGATWVSSSTNAMAPQSNNSGAFDGSNSAIIQGASSGAVEWLASSSTSPGTVNSGLFPVGSLGSVTGSQANTMLWDGSNFVAINHDTANVNYVVLTAPTGFAQGAGPVWTLQQTFAVSGAQLGSGLNFAGVVAFVPGVGYLTGWNTSGVNLSTAYGTMLKNTGLQTPLGTGTAYLVPGSTGNIFLIGNTAGALAESPDGVTWTIDQPNFNVGVGEFLMQAVYDSLHNTYIILGSNGSVCLGQVQAPFGRQLPASSPGVILTPNSNVVAPAGIGGDLWGANGGGITPVGGGVTGQTGYSKPVKVTVSDGERAANYIISGGQNIAGAPVSVVGAMGNDTLSGQTLDSSLPAGDSTLGTVG